MTSARLSNETVLKTRSLNDDLRIRRLGGTIVVTSGISVLGPTTVRDIVSAITAFNRFTPENDPYGEHDCTVMTVSGSRSSGRSTTTT